MAITPGPGYMIDPNNPNAVIPIGSPAQAQGLGTYSTPTSTQTPVAQAPNTPVPQVATPPVPAASTQQPPVTVNVGTPQTASQTPQNAPGTTQQPQAGQLQYDPTINPSVIDLLNQTGADSSKTGRSALASQLGVQNYDFSAAKNMELAKKYTEMYNAKKATAVPQNQAEAMQQAQTYADENQPQQSIEETQKAFFDNYMSMNPVMKTLYDTLNSALSSTGTATTFKEEYTKLFQEQGIPALQTEYMNIKNIMDGTEDDIRNEITKAGGFATESQVQAMSGARNKVLLKQANVIQQQLALKEDYVDQIMQFSQLDRKQVNDDLDRKLGLTEKLAEIQEKMTTAAKENYQKIVDKVGYTGLAEAVGDDTQSQKIAEDALGLPRGSLSNQSFLATEKKSEWSEPYKLGGDIVQKNLKTGEIKTAVNVSTGTGGGDGGKLLSVEDAMKLGVPYGTTQAQAAGIVPKKPLATAQQTDLVQAQIAKNNVERISELVDELGSQGPVLGRFRQMNPYDTRVVELNNLLTQTVPGLARGIFKEVGVLTDTDINRYMQTLANAKLTKEQANIATGQLLETINYSIKTQLDTYDKSGRDVRDFEDLKTSVSSAKPTKGATKSYQGATYTFDGTNWVKQK